MVKFLVERDFMKVFYSYLGNDWWSISDVARYLMLSSMIFRIHHSNQNIYFNYRFLASFVFFVRNWFLLIAFAFWIRSDKVQCFSSCNIIFGKMKVFSIIISVLIFNMAQVTKLILRKITLFEVWSIYVVRLLCQGFSIAQHAIIFGAFYDLTLIGKILHLYHLEFCLIRQ